MSDRRLADLKEKISQIRSDIDKKSGEREAEIQALKKEFGAKNLDQLYQKLDELQNKLEVENEQAENLEKSCDRRLKEYGY
jgi:predicted  nucleic acid-binding Zn-ribbon protein